LPSEAVQELRALTRARHDLVQARAAAKQRLRDELVVVFPELPTHTPRQSTLVGPDVLRLLTRVSTATDIAQMPLAELTPVLSAVSEGQWGPDEAQALHALACQSAASHRATQARGLVIRTMAHHLLDIAAHIADLEAAIEEVLARDDDGRHLQTLPGVGPVIAATIRAELGNVMRFAGVDQAIAYAGLDPRTHQSGTFVGQTHLSKRGPGALRHALYLATLNAVRYRPEWRGRYQRLLERGRAKKEALTILSRSLLKIIFHLLRTGLPYDPAALLCPKDCPAPGSP
jgi:transposase